MPSLPPDLVPLDSRSIEFIKRLYIINHMNSITQILSCNKADTPVIASGNIPEAIEGFENTLITGSKAIGCYSIVLHL